ncbi:MAG: succinate dehydrogenase, hydrophobic membrane anchor protein [Lautropia sp.]|nr:succinate dehydrogenase, hydrophobic membrane anchor protein [Lautropia sp.]
MTTQRIVSGAHYGLRDWVAQRVTGVVLALYAILLFSSICSMPQFDYANWSALFDSPFMKVATMLAVLSLIYHAWVGIRDLYMDYVQPTMIRLALQVLTILALAGYAAWAALILWRV